MGNALRRLLLGLLLVALPVQGFAAAAMLVCGARHESTASHAHHAAPAATDSHVHHGEATAPCAFTLKCDACAACAAFSAAAITAALPAAAPHKPAHLPIPFLERYPAIHVPDGLERPPRTTCA